MKRAPPVAEVGDADVAGDAAGDGDETAPEAPDPFFARRVDASVSAATRDAFVGGLVFELWRREPFVPDSGSDSDPEADGEGGGAAGTGARGGRGGGTGGRGG